MASASPSASLLAPRRVTVRLQTRFVLLAAGAAALVFTLIVIAQAQNTYQTTFTLFSTIAETSSAKVDASEQALRYIADMDTNAATFVATAPDNPRHWESLDAIHSGYQNFRNQMFAVRANLNSDEETKIYQQIEYFSFDQFWQHIGNLLTAQQNGDRDTALREYIIADNYLQNQIARYLLQLEALNFNAMQATQRSAAAIINGQNVLLAIVVIALAVGLTALSFWLRGKVRRLITPGIDAAMILGWVLAILMIIEIGRTPLSLRSMVEDAYYSVTASARVLAIANQANSAANGSVIDPTNAAYWQSSFDANKNSVELRLCGQPGCLANSFTSSADVANPAVVAAATEITQANQSAIGVKPLMANITFAGESQAIENARRAFVDYLNIDAKLRGLIKANNLDDASTLVTGTDPGQSAEAFNRFTQSIELERQINRDVFDNIWNTTRDALVSHKLLFGFAGYVLVMILIVVGVLHRFREL